MIDKERSLLLNFDKHGHVRKVLPIKQLIQIEESAVDSNRLNLHFSSRDTDEEIVRLLVSQTFPSNTLFLETCYQLLFQDSETKQQFIAELLAAQAALQAQAELPAGPLTTEKSTTGVVNPFFNPNRRRSLTSVAATPKSSTTPRQVNFSALRQKAAQELKNVANKLKKQPNLASQLFADTVSAAEFRSLQSKVEEQHAMIQQLLSMVQAMSAQSQTT